MPLQERCGIACCSSSPSNTQRSCLCVALPSDLPSHPVSLRRSSSICRDKQREGEISACAQGQVGSASPKVSTIPGLARILDGGIRVVGSYIVLGKRSVLFQHLSLRHAAQPPRMPPWEAAASHAQASSTPALPRLPGRLEAAASHAQARGTSTVMPPWSSLAHLFPLQVSLSTGLSRILAPAGLRVTVASCPPNGGSSDSNESASEHSTSKRSTSMYNTSKHSTSGQPQNRDGAAAVMTEGGRGGVGQWLEMGEGWMGSSSPCLKLLLFDTKPVSKGRQASGRQSTGHTKDGPAQRAGGDAIAEVEIQGQLESGGRGAMDAQGAVPAGESSVGKEEGEGECDADGSVGGRLLGVIYCSCDPECGMPFARLIRLLGVYIPVCRQCDVKCVCLQAIYEWQNYRQNHVHTHTI
eukprot:1141313-Pelagomonas_calceolata.AAC.1